MKTRKRRTGWNATTIGSTHSTPPTIHQNYNQGRNGENYLDSPPAGNVTNSGEMSYEMRREVYYATHYKQSTGIRIAGTLGGFFLIVLLTLLYKSKCKKHSRECTPIPPLDLSQLPQSNLLLNAIGRGGEGPFGGDEHYHDHDPDDSHHHDDSNNGHLIPLTFDSSHYMNMNQIHPYDSAHPYPLMPNKCYSQISPALLLTAANSESSEEDPSSSIGEPMKPMRPLYPLPPTRNGEERGNKCLGGNLSPPKMNWLHHNNHQQRNNNFIDINVILPTPTISPSGSEHFNNSAQNNNVKGAGPSVSGSRISRIPHLGSDRDRSSSVGSNSLSVASSSRYGGGVPPSDCAGNPLFFLDNLKYVDDTSSENIPTCEEYGDGDSRSIGSDSVFACFEQNFDHVAPNYGNNGRRISNVSGYSGGEAAQFKMTVMVTEAQAQIHHRDSFCSELESINDYMESARRRSSSTQTTFSDLQQCLNLTWSGSGYSPGGGSVGGGAPPPHSPRLSPHLLVRQGSGGARHGPTLLSVGPPPGRATPLTTYSRNKSLM